jgi:hypothetical protein
MATDWQAVQPGLIGAQGIATNSTTKKHELGTIIQAADKGGDSSPRGNGEFIYLQGLASVAVGEVCIYDSDTFIVKLAVANDIGPIGVAMAATVASEYGWFQIHGKGSALAATGFADNGDCYLTATAGTMDDADVAGDYITGMKGASAVSGGVADVELARPNVTNSVDN